VVVSRVTTLLRTVPRLEHRSLFFSQESVALTAAQNVEPMEREPEGYTQGVTELASLVWRFR
jgi:uncharacterized protein RhaS with RHS repeats